MERRSWPWKRKSSDKASVEKVAAILDSADAALALTRPQSDQENYKKPTYVQISVESYSHLTGLEDQVKTYEERVETLEDQVKTYENEVTELNEKLSEAESEMTTKENLVKQHAKVAEEAVSGWEKAEAEALALKNHLETVTLEKLSAEDRASHLDGALKECMKQIRNLKEDHEKNLNEVILNKTKQLEKIKNQFEAKIVNLDQELRKSASDIAALSRSLQEHSNMLLKVTEEKSRAEAEIEIRKSNIESCEREINSLKYDLHVASKELEIRNEEKNMSVKSAEVAIKQHMEGAKKIAKLEVECQRLRGLVRKKLPGPAALAQMKMEVDSLGRDYGEPHLRRSPAKSPGHRFSSSPEFSHDSLQKFQRESAFLTERLLATEEETKMLKEALTKRNSELQFSRSICAKTTSRLQTLEAQLHVSNNQERSSPSLVHNSSNPPSLTSMSEDGNDDDRSCCAESYVATSVSEFSPFSKDKSHLKPREANGSPVHLQLMDDFLEMEKLACSSECSGSTSNSDVGSLKKPDAANENALLESNTDSTMAGASSVMETASVEATTGLLPLSNLQSRIGMIFDSVSKEEDVNKYLDDIKQAVLEVCKNLQHQSLEENHCSDAMSKTQTCHESVPQTKDVDMSQDDEPLVAEANKTMSRDLEAAILQIHDFVLFLGKEAMSVRDMSIDSHELDSKIDTFSATYKRVLGGDHLSWDDFVVYLSHVLAKASELKFNILGYNESEVNGPDCIDKVALPENKVERDENSRSSISDVTSHPEVSDDGNLESGDEANATSNTVSLEDYEKLALEKDELEKDLAKSTESLETLKSQMQETEKLLAEIQSQLASAQRSNSLSETQLKCMVESYRSLEVRAQELETEVKLLRAKTESLESELQEEMIRHQDALTRCENLQAQLQRLEDISQKADDELQTNQEKELAAAAEKLAECQETIFLLGKQLNTLRPPQFIDSPRSERIQTNEGPNDQYNHYRPRTGTMTMQDFESDVAHSNGAGSESPIDHPYNFPCSPSETEFSIPRSPLSSRTPKHQSTLSVSSVTPTPEKHSRGFSRFFSSKARNDH